jgi:hypothetical protein
LDFHAQLAKRRLVKLIKRPLPLLSLVLLLSVAGGGALYAQLEGADRGVPPIESASTFEVTGVEVDVTAKDAQAAREEGWRQAQAKGWKALWASTNKRPQSEAPDLPDSTLNSMVSAIVIEQEQIGPKRYIARLGVLFDRSRSGELLGFSGFVRRSHPMLVIPVLITGSSPQSFESRNEWQKAWARFRTVNSPIDYVRPTGSGIDPLLLNYAETRRPGRGWWRMLLDSYGAIDIVVPEVQLRRSFPGGPAVGIFTARHGADGQLIARFALRAGNSASIPRMLDEGVRRIDLAYARAHAAGLLTADRTLEKVERVLDAVAEEIENQNVAPPQDTRPVPTGSASSFSIQVSTPDAASVGQAELGVSRVNGVTSALTTSLALGGTSVMRVTFVGDAEALAGALRAQGWTAQVVGGNTLRISR